MPDDRIHPLVQKHMQDFDKWKDIHDAERDEFVDEMKDFKRDMESKFGSILFSLKDGNKKFSHFDERIKMFEPKPTRWIPVIGIVIGIGTLAGSLIAWSYGSLEDRVTKQDAQATIQAHISSDGHPTLVKKIEDQSLREQAHFEKVLEKLDANKTEMLNELRARRR